jgi:hypothetical protein
LRTTGATGRAQYFDEIFVCAGPLVLADTGDNSYGVLFGAEWCALIDHKTSVRRLFRRVEGGWQEFTNDPRVPQTVFGQVAPDDERHISLAFDQSARVVYAYEIDGQVKVTRWDAVQQQYVQNVQFEGHDPCLLMDAEVADPRGYPAGVREAYEHGIPVIFRWTPNGQWLETAIPDSDVLVFYLSADRTAIRCRVQRQIYNTVNEIITFDLSVILDRVQVLPGRWQLLVADAVTGGALGEVVLSDPYIDEYIPSPLSVEMLAADVSLEEIVATHRRYTEIDDDTLDAGVGPEAIRIDTPLYQYALEGFMDGAVTLENITAVSNVYPYADTDTLDGGVSVEGILVVQQIHPALGDDALTGGIDVENIRVQTV